MIDHRYIYLLEKQGSTAVEVAKIRVFFARHREQQLHRRFGCSRFHLGDYLSLFERFQCKIKIGIAKDVNKRVGAINRSKLQSGSTEWFTLNFVEIACIRFWFCIYWLLDFLLCCLIGSFICYIGFMMINL